MTIIFSKLEFEVKCSECNYVGRETTEYTNETVGSAFDLILLYLLSPCPRCNALPEEKKLLELYEREQRLKQN